MATYKRRIVYMSDEEWTRLTASARKRGLTISAYLRAVAVVAAGIGDAQPGMIVATTAPTFVNAIAEGSGPSKRGVSAQTERDAILRKINKGG